MNKVINMKLIFLFFLFIGVAGICAAQDNTNLSLADAIALGVKNSKHLKISKAKIDAAAANTLAANQAKLPSFTLTGSYLWLSSANININKSNNGGSGNPNGESPSPNSAAYGIANISLPIYTGGKIKYGIESAKFLQQAVVLDAANDKNAVIYNITNAYVNLYKAEKAIQIVKQNLVASISRDSALENLERNGIIARNDLLKSQLQTSNVELTLLEAESNYKIAMINTNLLLGFPEENMNILTDDINKETPLLLSYNDYLEMTLNQRKDLQAYQLRGKANESAIKSAKADAYPNIALSGGYIAADIPGVITITNAVNIGVGLQYNLSNIWKKNTNLATAKATAVQIEAGQELLNDNIRATLSQDYQNYLLAGKKIEVFNKAQVQATENARIIKNKYNNSLATITEVLEAEASLLQANLNIELGKADQMLAYKKLLLTTGTIDLQ